MEKFFHLSLGKSNDFRKFLLMFSTILGYPRIEEIRFCKGAPWKNVSILERKLARRWLPGSQASRPGSITSAPSLIHEDSEKYMGGVSHT